MIIKNTQYNIVSINNGNVFANISQVAFTKNMVIDKFEIDSVTNQVFIGRYGFRFKTEQDSILFFDIVHDFLTNFRAEKLKRLIEE